MTEIARDRLFHAPADVVWEVVTDPNVYEEVAPNLSSVEILEGDGEGMVRECVDTRGNVWRESCYSWEEGRGFSVAVDVAQSDFHRRLFTRFDGEWRLADHEEGVRVTIRFDFETKYGPLGLLLARYLAYRATPMLDAIFEGWEAEIETRLVDPDRSTSDADPLHGERDTTQRVH